MGENMNKMNKKIINIGIAAVVCALYFPLILMLLQLRYVVPCIIPMGLTYPYQLQSLVRNSIPAIFLTACLFYMSGKKLLKSWAKVITVLFFGVAYAYIFLIAPWGIFHIAGGIIIGIIITLPVTLLLAVAKWLDKRNQKLQGKSSRGGLDVEKGN